MIKIEFEYKKIYKYKNQFIMLKFTEQRNGKMKYYFKTAKDTILVLNEDEFKSAVPVIEEELDLPEFIQFVSLKDENDIDQFVDFPFL